MARPFVPPEGLSRVLTLNGIVTQGGYYSHEFDVAHAAYIRVATFNDTSDIDLSLERWDGSVWVAVASSESASGNEYVDVVSPADGQYRARVYGYSVSGGSDSFKLVLAVPQGNDITVTGLPVGPVSAGTTVSLTASFSPDRSTLDDRDGTLIGVIQAGPVGATRALQIPIDLSYPLYVDHVFPAADESVLASTAVVSVRFSRRVDPSTLTAQTFYLTTATGGTVRGPVAYDDTSATARLVTSVTPGTTYTVVVTPGVKTVDGTALDGGYSWGFTTVNEQVPTLAGLTIPAGSVRYGSTTAFTATSHRYVTPGVPLADPHGRLALLFRASGSSAWTTVTVGAAGANGTWAGHITGSRPGYFKIARLTDPWGFKSLSGYDALAVTFAPSVSASVKSVRHGRSIKVKVAVKPGKYASRRAVRIERLVGSHWVFYRSVRLSSTGTASFSISRSTRGTRTIRARLTGGKGYKTGTSSSLRLRWW